MTLTRKESKLFSSRDEIAQEYKWQLEDLYDNQETWEKDYNTVQNLTTEFVAFKGQIAQRPETLLNALKKRDSLGEILQRLYTYAFMKKDQDTTNSPAQALADRAISLAVQVESALAFFQPELLRLQPQELASFLSQEAGLETYRHILEDIGRFREHTLSTEEETLLAQVGELAQAPSNIFGMLNDADLRFPVIKDSNEEEVEVTKGNYSLFLENPDRRVRRDAFQAVYKTYYGQKNTLAASYLASVKKDVFYSKVRHYPSSLNATLYEDNIPQAVYENLLVAIHEYLPSLHRYLELRKRILGVDELHMYDLYVPLIKLEEKPVLYEEAIKTVIQAMAPLGSEYQDILKDGFKQGWIDVHEYRGKRGGAYSTGAYPVHPYVLLNFHPNLNNTFTIAHEMGHALHTYFTFKKQPYAYSNYTIFVAEVASTLNETLLLNHLIKASNDKNQRAYLINHHLEQFRTTVFRQAMFAEFEKKTHEMVEQGESLTVENLSREYKELNQKFYGGVTVIDQEIALEWARIPHFYSAFYVYKYATGFTAATALAKQILEEGREAQKRYLKFLSSGSSKYSIDLLKEAGVDMASSEPVKSALDVFGQRVEELEELVQK